MKKMLLGCFFCLSSLFWAMHTSAQPNEYLDVEISLINKFKRIQATQNDDLRSAINDSIILELEDWLYQSESFSHGFDTLTMIGNILSDDKKVRVLSWNLPYNDGTSDYFGYIQHVSGKEIEVIKLNFDPSMINIPEGQSLMPKQWYGALYYQIVDVKHGGHKYYTLLGFIPDNIFTHKKIIDILTLNEMGLFQFGAPVFQMKNGIKNRVIFEYSARLVMMLRYNEKMDMIVYDHLSPSSPNYKGRFQFYGPDMSYDGLQFKKGFWVEQKDINIEY